MKGERMDIVVYFSDNTLSLIYKKRIIKKAMKSIRRGLIEDTKSFMNDFMDIMKKEKIKSKLFGDKICVVQDAFYSVRDLVYLESVFSQLGFLKVEFWDINKAFYPKYTYIGMFKDYMVLYLKKALVIDLNYFKNITKVIDYFKEYYQNYVVLFGSNALIPNIHSKLVNIYYIDRYEDYITQTLLIEKKYDV